MAALASIAYWPFFVDSIQLPKFFVLVFGTLLVYIFFKKLNYSNLSGAKLLKGSVLLFVFSMILSGFMNGQSIYEILIGTWGRYEGLATTISLLSLFLFSASIRSSRFPEFIIKTLVYLGYFMSVLGLSEVIGVDIITQTTKDPYIKLTFGNSNFASVFLVFTLTASLVIIYEKGIKGIESYILICSFTLQLYLIYRTNALQGLILAATSFFFLIASNFFRSMQTRYRILSFLLTCLGISMIIGLLARGNLTSNFPNLFYSLKIRFQIWETCVQIVKENFLFGVGIDALGVWFPGFRLKNLASEGNNNENYDSAHNVFLNYFATGGVFVFLGYLLITTVVAYYIYVSFKIGLDTMYFRGLVCVWITYQLQSLISIENIGISVWNWIISGAIVGVAINGKHKAQSNATANSFLSNKADTALRFFSTGLLYVLLVLVWPTTTSELQIKSLTYGNAVSQTQKIYVDKVNSLVVTISKSEVPELRNYAAVLLYKAGYKVEGLRLVLDTTAKFPRSVLAWEVLAQIYEKESMSTKAENAWKQALALDPTNEIFKEKVAKLNLS
jgi:hypothetical protein